MSTTMGTTAPASTTTMNAENVSLRRLVWVAPLAIVASLIANAIIRGLALALYERAQTFFPLVSPAFVPFTIGGVLAASVVFAIVARVTRRPITWYRRIAVVALLLSFLPDLGLLLAPTTGPGFPPPTGAGPNAAIAMSGDVVTVGALMFMHIATAIICVILLTRLTRAVTTR